MRALWLAVFPLLLGLAASDPPPALINPLPFDHKVHNRAMRSSGVRCVDCHPVGLVAQPPVAELPAPLSTCHGCHKGDLPDAPRGARATCKRCHADLQQLLPDTHGAGWRDHHALEGRAARSECNDCHDSTWCFDCHDDRGPLSENPHGPGFRVTHGVEARLDPHACTVCHSGDACLTCHQTGSLPW